MQRQEIPNNTPEQVRAYIEAAITLVDVIEPPAELREQVFVAAVNLIASKQIALTQPQPLPLGMLAQPRGRLA